MSSPAPSSREDIAQLMQVAGCDAQRAMFLLEANNGNLEMALQMNFELGAAGMSEEGDARGPQPGHAAAGSAPGTAPPSQVRRSFGVVRNVTGSVLRLPLVVLRRALGLAWSVSVLSLTMAAFVGDRVLPSLVMRGVRGTVAALSQLPDTLDPTEQARRFVAAFKASYGDRHPRFVEAGIKTAINQAKTEFKFVLAYLHSSEHQDSDTFCSEVLTNPELVTYINEHFVSWGGDVRHTDAFQLSHRLGVSRLPCVALLNTTPANAVQLVGAVQGVMDADAMLAYLVGCVERHGALLVAQRAELAERDYTRLLLQEQNAEYEQSLAADREREVKRRAEREAAEAKERVREAEEGAARAAEQAEETRRAVAVASVESRRASAKASLPEEPPSSATDAPTALVRLRLPDGGNVTRRFLADHTMGAVFVFVDSLDGVAYADFTLVCSYPRRVFTRADGGISLQDAGMAPQAALFVQPEE
ncbi:hypothetical protein FOA52_014799 [Chlamydomonas sp. UWO 241]|nr:hypothetical protein FOA52_014799 [Chlamydomonas sp. UWO 241]